MILAWASPFNIHVAHTLNSGLSVNNAVYTHRPIGILYKSQ